MCLEGTDFWAARRSKRLAGCHSQACRAKQRCPRHRRPAAVVTPTPLQLRMVRTSQSIIASPKATLRLISDVQAMGLRSRKRTPRLTPQRLGAAT